jgi:protease IV
MNRLKAWKGVVAIGLVLPQIVFSQARFVFPTLSPIESEMLWPHHGAALSRAPGEAWDATWSEGREGRPDHFGLAWQYESMRLMTLGPSDALWRHWQWSQGMRLAPGAWLGLTLENDTRRAWRNGLGLGLDGEGAIGPRLRLSGAIAPRVWNAEDWSHTWGAALRLNAESGKGRSFWLGAQWPWLNREPIRPQIFLTLQPTSQIGLQGRYDFEDEKVSMALNMAWGAHAWLGLNPDFRRIESDSRYTFSASEVRLRWRQQAYAKHLTHRPTWWRLTFDKPWVEGQTQYDFWGRERALGFSDVLQVLKAAQTETDVTGLFITLRGVRADLAMVQEVGRALDALRLKGKKVVLYTDEVTPLTMLLGAHASKFIAHPQGYFNVSGFSIDLAFYRKALDKLGIAPQFVRHGKYKAFDEPFTRTEPSPEFRFNTREWLHDLGAAYRMDVSLGRKLDTSKATAFLARGELSLDSAKAHGLVDTLMSEYSALQWVARDSGRRMRWKRPAITTLPPAEPPFAQRPRLAVVHLSGPILDDGASMWPLGGERGFSPKSVLAMVHQLKKDPSVKGVVLRLDSPGGSALASDIMAEALDSLRLSGKPMVLSVGGMAASGGYYLATACDRIVAEPTSMVGSIGVVWGKVSAESLYTKLGINHETIKTAPHADAMSSTRALNAEELAKIQNHLDAFYTTFTARVKKARLLDGARLDSVAEGRVFMGERARANGLVDTLGGLETALGLTKNLAGLSAKTDVEVFHLGPGDEDGGSSGQGLALVTHTIRRINVTLGYGLDRQSGSSLSTQAWEDLLTVGTTWAKDLKQPRVWALAPPELWMIESK